MIKYQENLSILCREAAKIPELSAVRNAVAKRLTGESSVKTWNDFIRYAGLKPNMIHTKSVDKVDHVTFNMDMLFGDEETTAERSKTPVSVSLETNTVIAADSLVSSAQTGAQEKKRDAPTAPTWKDVRTYKKEDVTATSITPVIIHTAENGQQQSASEPIATNGKQEVGYTSEMPAVIKLRKGLSINAEELEQANASRPVIASKMLFESKTKELEGPILDVASGPTSPVAYVANREGKWVVCVDKNVDYFGLLRGSSSENNAYVVADGFRLPFGDESFKTVTSSYFLDIFSSGERIAQALSEMRRVVKPDGKVLIEVTEAFGKYLPSLKPILEQVGLDTSVSVFKAQFSDGEESKSYLLECVPVQPVAIRATVAPAIPGVEAAIIEYPGRAIDTGGIVEKEHIVIVDVHEALDKLPVGARQFVMQTILDPVGWRFYFSDRTIEHFERTWGMGVEEAFGALGVRADLTKQHVIGSSHRNELVLRVTQKALRELYDACYQYLMDAGKPAVQRSKAKV